ncbi:MmgE/PrpD family protein [Mycobacterium sp. CBMA293]|nr:MmgE/PrpD family protein [Mycolicibacterium sp. CBMA 360]MUL57453.1 MmgE/PrpD family protein [Mycolicibacterium sp. CBMA 335]MUL70493.1 MmgE/PrpD family protein [Mycolicibacterium sp. CBMA 311]MUL92541.1 MmgE/PrpD family protein [Mycolicibacterium sp. CBMA 230]MUM04916.1 2-methylcitrate dehydratase [Mycolicibacterium sp. CBMA 213]MUM12376.1 MmgE/PrpD family protein [Mycolicibacterium sp. CBMA 293]
MDRLAEFVVAADHSHIPDHALMLLRRNVLDSLGGAIAALDGDTLHQIRDQIEATGGQPQASLIGGGRTTVDQATLFNSVAVRYVDLLDTYLTPGGLCHPADNFGAILSVAESVDAGGADFLLALAVSYEVQCRFSASVPVMGRGLNHALQLALSVAAGSAKLLGLTTEQTANALAMAVADNVSLAAIHSEPVSNWKGISPGMTAMRAVYTTALAQRGVTGPRGIIDGPNGLERLFDQPIDLHLDNPTLDVVEHTYLKKFSALIHGQTPIETILALRTEHGIDYGDVAAVDVDTFQTAYDIAGGGTFGNKDNPRTKEQADYNLKYLLAAALIDGHVGPDQLRTERIQSADVQELLRRITIRPVQALTDRYPKATPARVSISLRDGRRLTREQDDFEGAPGRSFGWDRTVEKFDALAAPYSDDDLRGAIVATVAQLDTVPLSALTGLLVKVSPERQS